MDTCITEALHRLGTMAQAMTDWEADWLAAVRRQGILIPQQRAMLARLCEQYLDQEGVFIAAEILGQQTLW